MKWRSVGLVIIFLSAIFYWFCYSMMRPMLALYFADRGYDAALVGIFMSAQSIMPLLFAIPLGGLIDRIGPRRSVFAGTAVGVVSCIMLLMGAMYEKIAPILVSQVLYGIGTILIWSALQAAISISARMQEEKGKRESLLSHFTFVNSLAQLAGPAAGGFFSEYGGFMYVFYLLIGFNVIGLLLSLWLPREGRKRNRDISFRFWKSYGTAFLLMRDNKPYAAAIGLNAVLYVLVDARMTFVPLFLAEQTLTHSQIGTVLAVAAAATMLIRPCIGLLLKWMSYHFIMSVSILIGGICMVLLSLAPPYWMIMAVMFGWGLCTGINQPMALIMVSAVLNEKNQGMGMSIRSLSNRMISGVNPLFFGSLSTLMGLSFAFGGMGVVLLMFGTVYFMRKPISRPAGSSMEGH